MAQRMESKNESAVKKMVAAAVAQAVAAAARLCGFEEPKGGFDLRKNISDCPEAVLSFVDYAGPSFIFFSLLLALCNFKEWWLNNF